MNRLTGPRFKLTELVFLLLCQMRRRFDDDGDILVAAVFVANIGDTLAPQTERRAGLGPLGDVIADLAVQRRDLDLCAAGGLGEGDGHLAQDVCAVTLKERMRRDTDGDEHIAVGPAIDTGVALLPDPDGLAVINPGGDIY